MKRLLVLLLISTIAYAIVEESNEYDDVSLEFNFKHLKKLANKAKKPISKVVKTVAKPIKKNVPKVVSQVTNPIKKNVPKVVSQVTNPIKKNVIKPSINTLTKLEPHIKKVVKPAIQQVNKFLKAHPKIKNFADPFIKEIKKHIKEPGKTIEHILKDPKNAQKIIAKALKPLIDKVKSSHPFAKIKAELRNVQNFMKKQKITVGQLQKLFGKSVEAIKKLPQQARNGIYWLKKNGYWEPIKFVVEQVGQYAATALCSAYLTPAVCEPAVSLAFSLVIDPALDKL